MSSDRIVVGIDVGTTKVCALIGEVSEDDHLEVIGTGIVPSRGLKKGVIVNMSSITGLVGTPLRAAYAATKSAILGYTRVLAKEVAAEGVRVNAVCPGWVDTPMFDAQVEIAGISRAEAVTRWAPDQLIERLVTPDEVSDAVLWLLSPAARMITGVALPVDGGMGI